MKIIAYTALRYGKDYLNAAIQSVIDLADEYHVLYAEKPSHGHWSGLPCPETESELHEIAWDAAGSKLRWHTGEWVYEHQQRNAIYTKAYDADVIVTVDSDEIYSPRLIETISQFIHAHGTIPPCKYVRVPFIHYWRSFHQCILHDPAFPARVIFPKAQNDVQLGWTPEATGVVNHMGYAIRPYLMDYKWQIHGHKDELRHDVDWFNDVYMANRKFDCHPVGSEWWNPEPIDPLEFMPLWMIHHPFYDLDVIE